MPAARSLLWCAAGASVAGVCVFAFVLPGRADDISPWWSVPAFAVVGVLFALVANRRRWWVGLGFAWLLAAWIEAGQAVWLPDTGRARLVDLVLGCVGGTIGVAAVVGGRALAARAKHQRTRAVRTLAAPTTAAEAPRTR